MKIDKVNDEFIVDCTNNTTEEKQQVYKFLVDNRGYGKIYLNNNAPIIVCNKKSGVSNWNTLEQYYNWFDSKKDLPVYSFEKFKEMYLEEQFILPARWCVRQNKQEINDWANQNRQTESNYISLSGVNLFHFPKVNNFHLYSEVQPGYTLLTFEQFKKHILKQTEMEKEIEYYLCKKLCWGKQGTKWDKDDKLYSTNLDSLPYFKETGLINNAEYWEAVYKEEFQVGDWVTLQGAKGQSVGQITEIDEYVFWGNGYSSYPKNLRKATPEEIEKASKTIVKMHSSNKGEFEIEVINKKAYYRPDNKELTREFVKNILNYFNNKLVDLEYSVEVDTLKVGCMEGTKKADWQKVYDLIK